MLLTKYFIILNNYGDTYPVVNTKTGEQKEVVMGVNTGSMERR